MGEIGTRLLDVGWDANDHQAQVVHLAAAFADSGEWAMDGYATAGRWIAHHLDLALRTANEWIRFCLLYTSPSPRDLSTSRMPSSA